MKLSKNVRAVLPVFTLGLSLLGTCPAYGFYNPSGGRWLSRDPLGDSATLNRETTMNPAGAESLLRESLKPVYGFARNDPLSHADKTGLQADVTWNPPLDTCKKGESIAFIQVGYGGSGAYSQPFVDDGSKGYYASGTGCPEYPNFGRPGNFEDTPGGATGPVQFVVCLVCTRPCCTRRGPGTDIHTIIRCKTWRKGDQGPLGSPTAAGFPDATPQQRAIWENALSAKYPDWRGCYKYKCTHKPA